MKNLEIELHQFETRTDKSRIEALIHRDFLEIGYSGKTYSKSDIINSLLAETPSKYSVWSQDFITKMLTEDLVQLVYKEAQMNEHGQLSRFALRTSIWQRAQGAWQVIFHQATPTSEFKKVTN